jgi:hypothetical protein
MSLSRLLLLGLACSASRCRPAPSRSVALRPHQRPRQPRQADVGLNLGSFPLTKVIDGDTIRVDGLDAEHAPPRPRHRGDLQDEIRVARLRQGLGALPRRRPGQDQTPRQDPHPHGRGGQEIRQGVLQGRPLRRARARPPQGDPRLLQPLPHLRLRREGRQAPQLQPRVRARRHEPLLHQVRPTPAASTKSSSPPRTRPASRRPRDLGPQQDALPRLRPRLAGGPTAPRPCRPSSATSEGKNDHIILTHYDAPHRLQDLLGREVVHLRRRRRDPHHATGPTKVMLAPPPPRASPSSSSTRTIFEATEGSRPPGRVHQGARRRRELHNKYKKRDELQIQVDARRPRSTLSPTHKPGYAPIGLTVVAPPEQTAPSAPEPPPESACPRASRHRLNLCPLLPHCSRPATAPRFATNADQRATHAAPLRLIPAVRSPCSPCSFRRSACSRRRRRHLRHRGRRAGTCVAQARRWRQLVITEIMADPDGADAGLRVVRDLQRQRRHS